MINSIIILFLVCLSILGYSILLKNFLKTNDKELTSLDLVYGIIFLIIISSILNLIYPIKYINLFTLSIGIILSIFYYNKTKLFVKKSYYFFGVLLLLLFITFDQQPSTDSEVYHLQIINKVYYHKLIFGLANLEAKYGMNSSWQIFLGLFNFELLSTKILYLINLIPAAIFFDIGFRSSAKNYKKFSDIYIISACLFLLFFSIIHPHNNGTIINLLGSVDADIPPTFFCIIIFYLLFKCLEEFNKEDLSKIIILTTISLTAKISYITLTLLPLYLIIEHKQRIFNKINVICLLSIFLYFLRGISTSGCLLFPVSKTCLPFFWSLEFEKVISYSNIIKGFARDRLRYTDFEYTIYSYDWLMPWIKNYFLKTSLLQITLVNIFIGMFVFFLFKKKNYIPKKNLVLITIYFLFSLGVWLNAPEVRFFLGNLVFMNAFLFSLFILYIKKDKILKKFSLILFSTFFVILSAKNINNKNYFFLNINPKFDYYYEKLKISDINILKILNPNDRCVDINEFCIYQENPNLKFKKINSYKFFYEEK